MTSLMTTKAGQELILGGHRRSQIAHRISHINNHKLRPTDKVVMDPMDSKGIHFNFREPLEQERVRDAVKSFSQVKEHTTNFITVFKMVKACTIMHY